MTKEVRQLKSLSRELNSCHKEYMRVQRRRFSLRALFPGTSFYACMKRDLLSVASRAASIRVQLQDLSEEAGLPESQEEFARFSAQLARGVEMAAAAFATYCGRLALKHQFGQSYDWEKMKADSRVSLEAHKDLVELKEAFNRYVRLYDPPAYCG